MFDSATTGVRHWIVNLFATAIKSTSRPEDRQAAIQWLLESREILASKATMAEKLKQLNALIKTRAAVAAIAAAISDAFKNYRKSELPWPMKIAMPATIAAIPIVGLHGAGIAALGSAIGLPVLLLVFLGTAGITSIIETVARHPNSRAGVAIIVTHILQAEATRRASADTVCRICRPNNLRSAWLAASSVRSMTRVCDSRSRPCCRIQRLESWNASSCFPA